MARAGGYETLWCADGATPQAEELKDCEVLMGYFPPALLPELPALKWLQTPAAGVDKLCGNIFARDDAVLTNCSGAFGVAIAEYMVTGILMLMRLMPEYASNQQHHVWKCMGSCRSIYGSTITVVGMGDIGSRFAHVAKAMAPPCAACAAHWERSLRTLTRCIPLTSWRRRCAMWTWWLCACQARRLPVAC